MLLQDPLLGWGGGAIWAVDSQENLEDVATRCQI